jgi:hypothetical protein
MSEDRQAVGSGQELPSTQSGEATHPSAGARSPGRRGFLLGTGGLAAAALVGGGWLVSEQVRSAGPTPQPQPSSGGSGPLDVGARRARALQLRVTTAHQQLGEAFPQPQPNGDEDRYEVVGLATFTRPCPTTPSARSTRAPTGPCCAPCAAAARRTSGGSGWAAGSSWPTPRAPSRSSSRAPTLAAAPAAATGPE